MTLRDFLLHETPAGRLVAIRDCGWQIGCTYIDHEDLFIGSLNPEILKKKVKDHHYERLHYASEEVLVVDI